MVVIFIILAWIVMAAVTTWVYARYTSWGFVIYRTQELGVVLMLFFLWFMVLPTVVFMGRKGLFDDNTKNGGIW